MSLSYWNAALPFHLVPATLSCGPVRRRPYGWEHWEYLLSVPLQKLLCAISGQLCWMNECFSSFPPMRQGSKASEPFRGENLSARAFPSSNNLWPSNLSSHDIQMPRNPSQPAPLSQRHFWGNMLIYTTLQKFPEVCAWSLGMAGGEKPCLSGS